MEQHRAMPSQGGQEQTLSPQEHRFEIARTLNVVINATGKTHDATGVDPEGFSMQLFLNQGAAGVEESHAIPLEVLENEPFTTKEAHSELALKGNADLRSQGRAQEGIFLTKYFVANFAQVDGGCAQGRERQTPPASCRLPGE